MKQLLETLDLALEALKEDRAWLESDAPIEIWEKNNEAITAIKQARSVLVQLPVASEAEMYDAAISWCDSNGIGLEPEQLEQLVNTLFVTICDTTPPAAPVQVSPLEFVTMVMEKEHLVGKPLFWAEWPNKENT